MNIVTEIANMRNVLEDLQKRIGTRQAEGITDMDPLIARLIGRKIELERALGVVERLQSEVDRLCARMSAGVEPANPARRSGPSQATPWFAYCPDGGFEFYSAEAEALEAGERIIQGWLDDCWAEEVTDVFVGKATYLSTEINRVERPDLVDEDGNGSDGRYWAEEWSYICNYELQPVQQDSKEQADAS